MTGGGFQTQVNTVPAPGIAGDYCSHNPRATVIAGPGGLVAGAAGVTVGRFAWATYPPDADGSPAIVNNFGYGPVTGFVHRAQQGLNTTFLAGSSNLVPKGLPITLHDKGEFWMTNDGTSEAQNGMKAFADVLTGKVSFAAAGSIPGGASAATTAIVQTTLTLLGGIVGNILTVASVSAGSVYPGAVLNSNAVGTVVSQLTGTPGGAGTYLLDTGEQTVATGTTIGGLYGLMTNGTVTGGPFTVGMVLTGTAVPAGDAVVFIVSGGGGTGSVMVVSSTTGVSSTTITGSGSVETKWFARSTGLAGEVVKTSDQPLG